MYFIPVNLFAVIVASVLAFLLGVMWYSPIFFGQIVTKLADNTEGISNLSKDSPWKSYIFSFVSLFVMAYVLFLLFANLLIPNIFESIKVAVIIWLGFVVTTGVSDYFVSKQKKSKFLFLINSGYHLVALVLISLAMLYFGV